MGVIRAFITLLTLANHATGSGYHQVLRDDGDMELVMEPQQTGGFYLVINKGEERQHLGHIGRTLSSVYILENTNEGVKVRIGGTNLTIQTKYDLMHDAYGVKLSWEAGGDVRLEDCLVFGSHHWYGGIPHSSHYPIETGQYTNSPSITNTSNQENVVERYWLNSNGEYFYVHKETPLFVDFNTILDNHICFSAQIASPYSINREETTLDYDYWVFSDPVTAHKHAIENYIGKLPSEPDVEITKEPIWTVKEFGANNETLAEYIDKIVDNGFDAGLLVIGESWEICFGSLEVDEAKFSNFTQTVQDLKVLGFQVSIWVHPFINKNCDPYYSQAVDMGYIVKNEAGDFNTTWKYSNSSDAVHVDFTNTDAADWWVSRILELMERYQIDGVECYAGESSLSPQVPVQYGNISLHPNAISTDYVKACALFGNLVQVNVGFGTQPEPVFIKSPELNSTWDNTGLTSIIPSLIQMNILGYTLNIPESIGGSSGPSKELYIRWLEATTFMPAMQFSYGPWNFDDETIQLTKKFIQLHKKYSDVINAAISESVRSGTPVNGPIWWIDPYDNQTYTVDDEYLLGDIILVAPILLQGATSRDVYLPSGTWLAEGNLTSVYEGPMTIKDYPAPLDTLPYFVRLDEPSSGRLHRTSAVLVVLSVLYSILV